MILTDNAFKVLTKIADKSKMDCWFCIKQGKNGDYVYDLENGKRLSLRQGVKQLIDGCIDLNIDELTNDEKYTLVKLLGELL